MSDPNASDPNLIGDDEQTGTMVGEYANYITVGSTQTEFYIDFFQVVPSSSSDDEHEHVIPVRRLLVSPMLMRGLMRALEEEVDNYESTYHLTLPTVES
jgi:hypothetical protein